MIPRGRPYRDHQRQSDGIGIDSRDALVRTLTDLAHPGSAIPSGVLPEAMGWLIGELVADKDVTTDKDAQALGATLATVCDALVAWAKIQRAGPAVGQRVVVGGVDYLVAPGWTDLTYAAEDWLQAAWLSLCGRRADLCGALGELPVRANREGSIAGMAEALASFRDEEYSPPFSTAFADALTAAFAGDGAAMVAHLLHTCDLLNHNGSPADDVADYITAPALRVLVEAMIGSPAGTDQALAEALTLHNRFWTASSLRRDHPQGFIAIPLLGIACWAQTSGVTITQKSLYLPSVIVDRPTIAGGDPGCLPNVTALAGAASSSDIHDLVRRVRERTRLAGQAPPSA